MSNVNVGSSAPRARMLKTMGIALLVLFALALLALNVGSVYAANWTSPQEIAGTNLASDDISTALESNGKQWVIWKDSPSGAYFQIWYSSRNANGNWASAGIFGNTQNHYFPSLGITNDDQKLGAWQEKLSVMQIGYVQFANAPGSRKLLPGGGTADYHPVVATSATGKRFILFSRGGSLYLAESSNGNNWNLQPVSGFGGNYYYPDITVDDSTGLIHVISWTDTGTIYYTQRSVNGGSWKNKFTLGAGKNANIAARDGKVVASWADVNANYQLAIRTNKNGNWGGIERPSPFSGGFRPHAVIDSLGNPTVVWMQNIDNVNYDIYYSDFKSGNWSAPKALKASAGFNEGNDIAIDSSDGMHTVFLENAGHKTGFSSDREGTGITPTPTATGPTATPTQPGVGTTRFNDSSSEIKYRGQWLYESSDANAIEGDYHATNNTNAKATLNFFGTAVKIFFIKSRNYGKADIFIDGQKIDTIDMYASSLTYQASKKYSGLAYGEHQLQIVNSGAKNPSSTGTYITLDAIDVIVANVTPPPSDTPTPTFTPTATQTVDPNITPTDTATPTETPSATFTPTNTPPRPVKTYYDDRNAAVQYAGRWTLSRGNPACLYKGTLHSASSKPKNKITLTFNGSQLKYWFVTGPNMGRVQILIDGEVKGTANLNRAETLCKQWTSGILAAGQHTVELRPKGKTGEINMDVIVSFP